MLNLIKKDYLLPKRKIIIYVICCFLMGVFLKLGYDTQLDTVEKMLTATLGAFFSYFIASYVFEIEGKNKTEATIASLPYTRQEIVLAKYLCVILDGILFYAICIFEMGILSFIKMGDFSLSGILYGLSASLIIYGSMIPFFIKFDYVKAANMMRLVYFAGVVFFVSWTKNIIYILHNTKGIELINDKVFFIISIIWILLSYLISNSIYEKKELI